MSKIGFSVKNIGQNYGRWFVACALLGLAPALIAFYVFGAIAR